MSLQENILSDMKPHSYGHDPKQTGSVRSLFRHMVVIHEAIKVMQLLALSNKKTSATHMPTAMLQVSHSQSIAYINIMLTSYIRECRIWEPHLLLQIERLLFLSKLQL